MKAEPPTRRRFRLRTIPVAIVGFFSLFFLGNGVFAFVVMAVTTWLERPLYEPGPSGFTRDGFAVGFGGLIFGAWLLGGAVALAKGKWPQAAVLLGSCFIAVCILQVTGLID